MGPTDQGSGRCNDDEDDESDGESDDDHFQEDILLARTREEHIRLTARANEAAHLAAEAAR